MDTNTLYRFVCEIFDVKLLKASPKSDIWLSQGHWPELIPRFSWGPIRPCQCASNEIYCVDFPSTVCFIHWITFFYSEKNFEYWILPKITRVNFQNSSQLWGLITPGPLDRPNPECLVQLHSLLYVAGKNQLNCLISSTSYVMTIAHLCLGRTKTNLTSEMLSLVKAGDIAFLSSLTTQGGEELIFSYIFFGKTICDFIIFF